LKFCWRENALIDKRQLPVTENGKRPAGANVAESRKNQQPVTAAAADRKHALAWRTTVKMKRAE